MMYHLTEKIGGAEMQVDILSRELAKNIYDVFYLAETAISDKIGTVEEYKGVKIAWLSRKRFSPYNREYYKTLIKINPEIVIQRHISPLAYVTGRYCKKYNRKFILMCHDDLAPFRDLFPSDETKYPLTIFLDHEMQIIGIYSVSLGMNDVNAIIQNMLDNI